MPGSACPLYWTRLGYHNHAHDVNRYHAHDFAEIFVVFQQKKQKGEK